LLSRHKPLHLPEHGGGFPNDNHNTQILYAVDGWVIVEKPCKGKDFKASVDVTVNAEAGVKLKLLGYELAEWSKTFELIKPWNLWKFPKDKE